MTSSPAIEVTGLSKTYRNGLLRRPFEALTGITFRVERGEVFGLLGPNGAGKTTFIKILLGIVRKTRGAAWLLGRPAGDRASRLKVGFLPENLRVAGHHTAVSALQYYGQLSGLSAREIRAKQQTLLESVGLADRSHDRVKKYSKGMIQRLGLAQALLHEPELLVLDEPTDGLDPVGRSHVRHVLHQLKAQGRTVFLNSHILQEVELVCDRVAILDRGQLRALGSVQDIAPRQSPRGFELELLLAGPRAEVSAAMGDRGINRWETTADGQHRLLLRLMDQDAVDDCTDNLRRRKISIVALARRRVTLEDAFLHLFAAPPNPETEASQGGAPRN